MCFVDCSLIHRLRCQCEAFSNDSHDSSVKYNIYNYSILVARVHILQCYNLSQRNALRDYWRTC